jgi:hypothetical protein
MAQNESNMVQNESNMVQASQPVVQPAVLKLCVPVKVRVKNPQGGFKSEDGVAFFTRSRLVCSLLTPL